MVRGRTAQAARLADDCVALIGALDRELYPRPLGRRPVDDSVLGLSVERRFAELVSAEWRRVSELHAVASVVGAGRDRTAYVIAGPPGAPSHAVALHHDADGELRWVDVQAAWDGARPSVDPDAGSAVWAFDGGRGRTPVPMVALRAIVVDEHGRPLDLAEEAASPAVQDARVDVLVDPSTTTHAGALVTPLAAAILDVPLATNLVSARVLAAVSAQTGLLNALPDPDAMREWAKPFVDRVTADLESEDIDPALPGVKQLLAELTEDAPSFLHVSRHFEIKGGINWRNGGRTRWHRVEVLLTPAPTGHDQVRGDAGTGLTTSNRSGVSGGNSRTGQQAGILVVGATAPAGPVAITAGAGAFHSRAVRTTTSGTSTTLEQQNLGTAAGGLESFLVESPVNVTVTIDGTAVVNGTPPLKAWFRVPAHAGQMTPVPGNPPSVTVDQHAASILGPPRLVQVLDDGGLARSVVDSLDTAVVPMGSHRRAELLRDLAGGRLMRLLSGPQPVIPLRGPARLGLPGVAGGLTLTVVRTRTVKVGDLLSDWHRTRSTANLTTGSQAATTSGGFGTVGVVVGEASLVKGGVEVGLGSTSTLSTASSSTVTVQSTRESRHEPGGLYRTTLQVTAPWTLGRGVWRFPTVTAARQQQTFEVTVLEEITDVAATAALASGSPTFKERIAGLVKLDSAAPERVLPPYSYDGALRLGPTTVIGLDRISAKISETVTDLMRTDRTLRGLLPDWSRPAALSSNVLAAVAAVANSQTMRASTDEAFLATRLGSLTGEGLVILLPRRNLMSVEQIALLVKAERVAPGAKPEFLGEVAPNSPHRGSHAVTTGESTSTSVNVFGQVQATAAFVQYGRARLLGRYGRARSDAAARSATETRLDGGYHRQAVYFDTLKVSVQPYRVAVPRFAFGNFVPLSFVTSTVTGLDGRSRPVGAGRTFVEDIAFTVPWDRTLDSATPQRPWHQPQPAATVSAPDTTARLGGLMELQTIKLPGSTPLVSWQQVYAVTGVGEVLQAAKQAVRAAVRDLKTRVLLPRGEMLAVEQVGTEANTSLHQQINEEALPARLPELSRAPVTLHGLVDVLDDTAVSGAVYMVARVFDPELIETTTLAHAVEEAVAGTVESTTGSTKGWWARAGIGGGGSSSTARWSGSGTGELRSTTNWSTSRTRSSGGTIERNVAYESATGQQVQVRAKVQYLLYAVAGTATPGLSGTGTALVEVSGAYAYGMMTVEQARRQNVLGPALSLAQVQGMVVPSQVPDSLAEPLAKPSSPSPLGLGSGRLIGAPLPGSGLSLGAELLRELNKKHGVVEFVGRTGAGLGSIMRVANGDNADRVMIHGSEAHILAHWDSFVDGGDSFLLVYPGFEGDRGLGRSVVQVVGRVRAEAGHGPQIEGVSAPGHAMELVHTAARSDGTSRSVSHAADGTVSGGPTFRPGFEAAQAQQAAGAGPVQDSATTAPPVASGTAEGAVQVGNQTGAGTSRAAGALDLTYLEDVGPRVRVTQPVEFVYTILRGGKTLGTIEIKRTLTFELPAYELSSVAPTPTPTPTLSKVTTRRTPDAELARWREGTGAGQLQLPRQWLPTGFVGAADLQRAAVNLMLALNLPDRFHRGGNSIGHILMTKLSRTKVQADAKQWLSGPYDVVAKDVYVFSGKKVTFTMHVQVHQADLVRFQPSMIREERAGAHRSSGVSGSRAASGPTGMPGLAASGAGPVMTGGPEPKDVSGTIGNVFPAGRGEAGAAGAAARSVPGVMTNAPVAHVDLRLKAKLIARWGDTSVETEVTNLTLRTVMDAPEAERLTGIKGDAALEALAVDARSELLQLQQAYKTWQAAELALEQERVRLELHATAEQRDGNPPPRVPATPTWDIVQATEQARQAAAHATESKTSFGKKRAELEGQIRDKRMTARQYRKEVRESDGALASAVNLLHTFENKLRTAIDGEKHDRNARLDVVRLALTTLLPVAHPLTAPVLGAARASFGHAPPPAVLSEVSPDAITAWQEISKTLGDLETALAQHAGLVTAAEAAKKEAEQLEADLSTAKSNHEAVVLAARSVKANLNSLVRAWGKRVNQDMLALVEAVEGAKNKWMEVHARLQQKTDALHTAISNRP